MQYSTFIYHNLSIFAKIWKYYCIKYYIVKTCFSEVLQKPFLQFRESPIDYVRPRNLFVDCNTFLQQHPIDYSVFKGIFHRKIKAKIDPNPPGTGNIGLRSSGRLQTQPQSNCVNNCLDSGKRRIKCKRVCRCRSNCTNRGRPLKFCRKRCKNQLRRTNWFVA